MTVRWCCLIAVCFALAPQAPTTRAGAPADRFGDPLPEGALARMGTIRFRHDKPVRFVAALPDRKTIIALEYATIRWWDAASGKEVRRLTDFGWSLGDAALSPDGKVLVVYVGIEVRALDAATGKELWKIEDAGQYATAIAFSADGKVVATGGDTIHCWDGATGTPLREFKKVGSAVYGLAFSADGRTLVSASRDGSVRWWDLDSGKVAHAVEGSGDGGALVAASADGRRLATVGPDGSLRLWDAVQRIELHKLQNSRSKAGTGCITFSPDGKLLAAGGGGDCLIHLYDASTGNELRRCEGHQDEVWSLAFSPDGATLVSGGRDSAVRQWDVSTGKEIRPLAGPWGRAEVLAVSPDGATVASAGTDSRVHLWKAATGEERRSLNGSRGDEAVCLSFGADGRTVTEVCRGRGLVRVWDAGDGKQVQSFSVAQKGYSDLFALSPDGAVVAAFDERGQRMALFDAAKGETLHEYQDEDSDAWVAPGHFLGTGRVLAAFRSSGPSLGRTTAIMLWDVRTGAHEMQPLQSDRKFSDDWAASPDGRIVAVSGEEGVELWDTVSGKLIRSLGVNYGGMFTIAFSADGRTISVVDVDGNVVLWETASGLQRGTLQGAQARVNALAFSPDGRRLYTAGDDGTVLAWDLTGRRAAAPVPADLDGKALEKLWDDLAGADAAEAYKAVWTLAAAPEQSVPFLKARLHQTRATPAQIAAWITDLDSDDFDVRQKASAELRRQHNAAESAVTTALAARPSPEAARRMRELLEPLHWERRNLHPSDVRLVRAVEALECIGTPAVREILTDLADGPDKALGCEAKGSLERLQRRKP